MADDGPSARAPITVITSDDQEFTAVDCPRWERLATEVLVAEDVAGPVEVGLGFIGIDAIARLHADHLGGTGPTDVLSFPLDDEPGGVPGGQVRLLGDVVVCPEVAARQASEAGHAMDDELAVLVVHGVLHLLGFDHAEPTDEALMFARQAELVEAHSKV